MTGDDELLEHYRAQVFDWLQKQYYFFSRDEIVSELVPRFMAPALIGKHRPGSLAIQRFLTMTSDFHKATGVPRSIVIPCGVATHAQPCICAFQWFRFHRGAHRIRISRALSLLTEAHEVSSAADTLHIISESPSQGDDTEEEEDEISSASEAEE